MSSWSTYVVAERELFEARRRLLAVDGPPIEDVLREAFGKVAERGPALRLLLSLSQAEKCSLFGVLVELASCGHSDIGLVRQAIASIGPEYADGRLWDELQLHLKDSEAFRRYAELLAELGRDAELADLARIALMSDDEDVQEVGMDFGSGCL